MKTSTYSLNHILACGGPIKVSSFGLAANGLSMNYPEPAVRHRGRVIVYP